MDVPWPSRIKESRSFSESITIFDLVASRKAVARFCNPKGKVGGCNSMVPEEGVPSQPGEPHHPIHAMFR